MCSSPGVSRVLRTVPFAAFPQASLPAAPPIEPGSDRNNIHQVDLFERMLGIPSHIPLVAVAELTAAYQLVHGFIGCRSADRLPRSSQTPAARDRNRQRRSAPHGGVSGTRRRFRLGPTSV